jgi:NAD(P)H-dependent FMN reductase
MSAKLLIVSASTREASRTRALAKRLLPVVESVGAQARLLDLHETRLPLFISGDEEQAKHPAVELVKESAGWADAFLLGTPEYHGGMSSAMKNWLDHLYEELAGKLAGVYAVTGGGGGDMSITSVKDGVHWCHGFTLPFHAAARGVDFEGTTLVNNGVWDRMQRIVFDLLRYAPLLHGAFEEAKGAGEATRAGFARFHL